MRTRIRDEKCSEPSLSIVIPTHNGRQLLESCLRTVIEHRPVNSEVVVVDDGSQDGTGAWLKATHPDIRLIRLPRNRGFCTAVNVGIKAARAAIVETLNNDALVTPGWAENALRLFDDPTVASVAPLVWLVRPEGLVDSAGDQYHISGWAVNRGHLLPVDQSLLQVREVFGASASAAFFRRDALLRVGGFPEHFRSYFDDVDVAFRLRWASYRCLYTPHSQVFHGLNHSHNHSDPGVAFQLALNEERVFWTNLEPILLRRGIVPHLLYVAYCAASRLVQRDNSLAYLRGKLAVLREVPVIKEQRVRLRRVARGRSMSPSFSIETEFAMLRERFGRGLKALLRISR